MKRIVLFILSFILHTAATAQAFKVREVSQNTLNFPIFSSAKYEAAAKKINVQLQLSELKRLGDDSSMFASISIDDGTLYGSKVAVFYDVHCNNDRVLSVSFGNGASGTTTHYWNSYHNYNSVNGTRISLRDLCSRAGYTQLLEMASQRMRQTYLRESQEAWCGNAFRDDTSCISVAGLMDAPGFFITDDSLFIDNSNCLIKAYMFCGRLRAGFSVAELGPMLSAYGKAALLGEGDMEGFISKELPQLMVGRLNEQRIFMLLQLQRAGDATEVQGLYAYVDKGIGVPLMGTLTAGKIQLTEYRGIPVTTPDGRPAGNLVEHAVIDGTLKGTTLRGTWKDSSGNTYLISASQTL